MAGLLAEVAFFFRAMLNDVFAFVAAMFKRTYERPSEVAPYPVSNTWSFRKVLASLLMNFVVCVSVLAIIEKAV